MLLVDHFVAKSNLHGLGVFTKNAIKKGDLVWIVHPLIDIKIQEDDIADLPDHVKKRIRCHTEYHPAGRYFILSADGDSWMNHADVPNIDDRGREMFAARDICAGEEMTIDYRKIVILDFYDDFEISNTLSRISV